MPTPPVNHDRSDQDSAAPPLPLTQAPRGASGTKPPLPEAARRALAEAAARRREGEKEKADAAHEVGGRGGLDPTRYGDWEVNGIASDF